MSVINPANTKLEFPSQAAPGLIPFQMTSKLNNLTTSTSG